VQRLRARFVCVRIVRMNGIDTARFDHDQDTSWAAYFLDERLRVYSRFGGRDAGEPDARLRKPALLGTMQAVLAAHAQARTLPPREADALFAPEPARPAFPEDIPLLKRNHQGCVHCHQIREYQVLQWGLDGQFDRDRLFVWPLPENVGLRLDLDHGRRVADVVRGSAAERAGFAAGDLVVRAGDVPIRSELDLRRVLDRHAGEAPLSATVLRARPEGGAPAEIRLELRPAPGWRETDLGWRKSLRSVPFAMGLRGYSLGRSERAALKLGEGVLAVKVLATTEGQFAESLGLRRGDVIVAAAGRTDARSIDQLKGDWLRAHRPGDEVRVTVLRNGTQAELTGRFPAWRVIDASVP
jgi:membrane-associated protease RseP (regulator of RpoE activity)